MNVDLIHYGASVKTHPDSRCSILAVPKFLQNRREGTGKVLTLVEGHIYTWWVKHSEDNALAPYMYFELELNTEPAEEPSFILGEGDHY